MSSSSGFKQSLRRLKPEKGQQELKRRDRSQLQFLAQLTPPFPKLLLDTTVYIDVLQGRMRKAEEIALRSANVWHSTVTEAELSAVAGLLDQARSETARVIAQLAEAIDQRRTHRILTPDRETWREAGILAGALARVQRYGRGERRRTLNDALIFVSGTKNGCVVLTRNLADFDLLMQLDARGRAVFYDVS